jgi:hypothetical protein
VTARPSRTRLGTGLAATMLAGLLGACGVPHPGLSNGSVSVCFRALPVAINAVHDRSARMVGLHRIDADTAEARLPVAVRPQIEGDQDTAVCAVIFEGHFSPGQVTLAPTDQQGRYAVVLVTSKHLHLLAAFVVDRLPDKLGQRLL